MKKILVPVDFSETSENAFDFALQLADKTKAELQLVHVIDVVDMVGMSPMGSGVSAVWLDNYVQESVAKAKQEIKKLVSNAPAHVRIDSIVEVGNIMGTIRDAIKDNEADLVVMGTKGASGMREVLVGSNTEKVVRYARCPVISIKKKTDVSSIKNIVFGLGLEGVPERVVQKLKQLQSAFNATLHLVHVNTPTGFERDRKIKRGLEQFAMRYMLTDYTINIYNEFFEDEGLIYFAEEIGADMIAVATHSRSGLAHLLGGSIAEDLVNHVKRPIWTYSLKADD
ncbi:MAG TPA: universal stress protein [Cyclobacteriaceae bacterium]|nr:universal stress protein [Cyclobacteriaceae bacterium]